MESSTGGRDTVISKSYPKLWLPKTITTMPKITARTAMLCDNGKGHAQAARLRGVEHEQSSQLRASRARYLAVDLRRPRSGPFHLEFIFSAERPAARTTPPPRRRRPLTNQQA